MFQDNYYFYVSKYCQSEYVFNYFTCLNTHSRYGIYQFSKQKRVVSVVICLMSRQLIHPKAVQ